MTQTQDQPDYDPGVSLSGFLWMLEIEGTGEASMQHTGSYRPGLVSGAVMVAVLLVWATASEAQTVTGKARAVKATVFSLLGGTTTVLADTGALGGTSDALQASAPTGNVPSLLTGEALHATTIGWPDQVASEASLAALTLRVAGTTIGADSVMARALAVLGGAGGGASDIANLSINGVPIPITGAANQTIYIPGGRVVINEQQALPTATVVNALHVVVSGVADVVIASATAGIH